jgi:hypothetical protein
MKHYFLILWMLTACVAGHIVPLHARLPEKIYLSERRIDSAQVNRLFVTVDNINFFKNNEWVGPYVPGYTLPGLWLQPKMTYYLSKHIKIEAGVHSLWYWGAHLYPSYTYSQLPYWDSRERKQAAHILPYFRVQAAFSPQLQIIMGNIYGGSNHGLIEPLYNPELNLTADPEHGMQILYRAPWVEMDTWINWTEFIYRSDTHQESFVYGLSSHLQGNRPESRWHVSFPVQLLAQHHGGQIDATDLPVQTILNAAAGAAVDWNLRCGALTKLRLEWALTGHYQPAGETWLLKRGYGSYTALGAEIAGFDAKAAYWQCDRFISLFGNPLYNASSLSVADAFFERPQMLTFSVAYTHSFGSGVACGVDFDLYYRLADRLNDPSVGVYPVAAKPNYSFGVYFRVNPSFLVKAVKMNH